MKKTQQLLLIFLLLNANFLFSQDAKRITNLQDIKEERYADIKGSPYVFKDWIKGTITEIGGAKIENQLINYNGYEKGFEVKKGDQFAELDNAWYSRVELFPENGEPILFKRGLNKKFGKRFVQVLHDGEKIKFIKEPFKSIDDKEIQDYGKTLRIRAFSNRKNYYLIEDGKLTLIKLRKKAIFAKLGNKKEIESFAKKNKIKIDSEEGLTKILAYLKQ